MKLFRKISLCILVFAISLPTCFLSGCVPEKEVISEEDAITIITEYYETIKAYVENAGYSLDLKYAITPQLEVGDYGRRIYSDLYFDGNDTISCVIMSRLLTEEKLSIAVWMKSNKNITENDQVLNDMQMIITLENLVSERQFTLNEYVDFFTDGDYIPKFSDSGIVFREKFIDFWGNIRFRCWENKEYDDELGSYLITRARYEYNISSKSKSLV